MAARSSFSRFGPVGLVVVATCLAGMVALIYWSHGHFVEEVRFLTQAEVVRGTVLARDDASATVTYRFAPAPGRTIEASDVVSIDVRETLEAGGAVDIEYLPAEPAQSRVREPWAWVWSLAAFGLPLLAALVLAGYLAAGVSYQVKERRLWRHGLLADATVIAVSRGTYARTTVGWRQLRYRFVDRAGVAREGETPQFPEGEGTPEVGDRGSVRYDPNTPDQNAWMGLEPGQREHRLARDEVIIEGGEALCWGKVLSVTKGLEDGEEVWRVRYQYRDQDGRVREGEESEAPRPDGGPPYPVGSKVEVAFDPAAPGEPTLWGPVDEAADREER